MQAVIDRFGFRIPVLTLTTVMSKLLLEVGDSVFVTFENVVNLATATRALSSTGFEIIRMDIDFIRNSIDFELLGYPGVFVSSNQFSGTASTDSDVEADVMVG